MPEQWQPDPKTLAWVAHELQWELDRQDSRGPAASVQSVISWLGRVAKDKRRLAESRWTRNGNRPRSRRQS